MKIYAKLNFLYYFLCALLLWSSGFTMRDHKKKYKFMILSHNRINILFWGVQDTYIVI